MWQNWLWIRQMKNFFLSFKSYQKHAEKLMQGLFFTFVTKINRWNKYKIPQTWKPPVSQRLDHVRMKVLKKYCLLKLLNLPLKPSSPSGDLWNWVHSSSRMFFLLVTFYNICDKTGFGSIRWNTFFSVLKVTRNRNMLKS